MAQKRPSDRSGGNKNKKQYQVSVFTGVEHYNLPRLLWVLENEDLDESKKTQYKKLLENLEVEWPVGKQTVHYHYNELGMGRLQPDKFAFILMSRKIRQTLANGNYYDLDMVNCHPHIFFHLCQLHINDANPTWLEQIRDYVKDREKIIEEAMDCNPGVSKDVIKTWFLKIINGGDGITDLSMTSFMAEFLINIPKLIDKLYAIYVLVPRYEKVYAHISSQLLDANKRKVSFMAHVLQDYEDRLLKTIRSVFISKGIPVNALCYDGLMGLSDDRLQAINDEDSMLVRDLYDQMRHDVSFSIPLALKSMLTELIEIPPEQLERYTEQYYQRYGKELEYQEVKRNFELNNFFCSETVCYYTEHNYAVLAYTRTEFCQKYENILYEGVDKRGNVVKLQFITEWFKDEHKRSYPKVGLYPPGCIPPPHVQLDDPSLPNYAYRLWKGLRAEHIKPDTENHSHAVELFRAHTLYLCGGSIEFRAYLERILKHIFVYPGCKTDVAIGFKAVTGGEGKNTWWEIVSEVIGKQYCFSTSNLERDVFGDFNEGLRGKIWVHLEEVSKTILIKHQKHFLSMITCKEEVINLKGGKKITSDSLANYFLSFNTQGVEMFPGLHRRIWIHEMEGQVKDAEYYGHLYRLMQEPQSIRAIYDWIMTNVEIDGFEPKSVEQRPFTPYMTKLWGRGNAPKDKVEQFFKDFIIEKFNDRICPMHVRYQVSELYNMFKGLAKETAYIPSIQNFSNRIADFFGDRVAKKMSKGAAFYVFDIDLCVTFLVDEKQWLDWKDLGYSEEYTINNASVKYSCLRPCLKSCQNAMAKKWRDDTSAIQYYTKFVPVNTTGCFQCPCNGHFEIVPQ